MDPEPRSPRLAPVLPHASSSPDDPRLAPLRADVAGRIRRVCADLPPDAFDALVWDICAMKLRWDPDATPVPREP